MSKVNLGKRRVKFLGPKEPFIQGPGLKTDNVMCATLASLIKLSNVEGYQYFILIVLIPFENVALFPPY